MLENLSDVVMLSHDCSARERSNNALSPAKSISADYCKYIPGACQVGLSSKRARLSLPQTALLPIHLH